MPSDDPIAAALAAADRIREGILPKVRDRFAEAAPKPPRISLERFAALPEDEAQALLDKHGPSLEAELRRQATERLRKAGRL